MSFDVGIIGGGVIGLSCAWRLAQSGARVALFERGEIGREASWAAAGMLAAQCEAAHHPPSESGSIEYSKQQAMFDLCLQSRAMYADFADELFDATGVDIELSLKGHKRNDWRTPGILYVQTRDDDPAIANFVRQKQQGQQISSLESIKDVPIHREIEWMPGYKTYAAKGFSFSEEQAVWLPSEGQVNNRQLVGALRRAIKMKGVAVRESEPVEHLEVSKSEITKVITSQNVYHCSAVLLCAGTWSGLVRGARAVRGVPSECLPPTQPIAGQMLSLRNDVTLRYVLYSSDIYLVPRAPNRLLVGATVEDVGIRKLMMAGGVLKLLQAACALVPELTECPLIDQWVGLRPSTPDGLPVISKTSLDNFYIATGHYRNGILLAPITAKLMTDCILNHVEPPREFSIERFQNEEVAA